MTNSRYAYHGLRSLLLLLLAAPASAQMALTDSSQYYNEVKTYVNPVLPGDHPDPTLLKVGNDFYHCGSSFHFTPYLPVYHSTDLVHWTVISRVVPPATADWVTDRPSAGIWQGAITYFYGSYWIYFSANGQWFCKADSPYGPWTRAVKVNTNATTGNLGYDNSIFVDDDGKPYMVIKNGQKINRLQALGRDGQLTDTVINLDWINARLQYSWAEGPVMCKRNGYYFYFPAGDVAGGQFVLRTKKLTSDSTQWERLGDFFKPVTDSHTGFRRPNHISAPLQLADGSWWTLGQSYEKYEHDDWSGMGRQTALYPVSWEGDRPWGMAPAATPVIRPALPPSATRWRSVTTDYFDSDTLGLCWHFLSKGNAASYTLQARNGWVRLLPTYGRTSLVQKETDHYYAAVTRVDLDATDSSHKAGIYCTNGNQKVYAGLYSGFHNGKVITLRFDTAVRSIPNRWGNTIWLKLVRSEHALSGSCSGDGISWTSLGAPVNVANLDKAQANFNSWVGTSVGLFAEGRPADFDCFVCKDAATALPVTGYSNYFGVERIANGPEKTVTNTSDKGGWLMLSGMELGSENNPATQVELVASAQKGGNIQVWLDDLGTGRMIAEIPVTAGSNRKTFSKTIAPLTGQHDVFIKFPEGTAHDIQLASIRFAQSKMPPAAPKTHSDNGDGTYTNPLIAADFPDPDVIRVGDMYYMVTTTMFIFPGVTVLKSHDLVNWEYCSNAVPRFDFGKCYNLDSCNRYGHGQWATSMKYHNGKFYLLFITLNEGGFMCTADKAEGPWKITHLPKGFYDPGLFFDDDGRIYVAQGYGKISITEVDANLAPIGRDSLVYTGDIRGGLEGTHVYKIDGYYYLYCTYGGLDGIQVALRSKNIYGPYTQKIVIRDTTHGINFGIHQGALIQTQKGEWWTILFVDSGPFGRFPSLQPVTWTDGWPMVGVDGKAVITYKKPEVGKSYPVKTFPTSDEFDSTGLGMQWGWNHNPDPAHWSLTRRPGFLRLTTGRVVRNLTEAPNMLTQRPFAKYEPGGATTAVIKLETAHMKDGDITGLAVFQDPYAFIGVRQVKGVQSFVMVNNGQTIDSAAIRPPATAIYLRVVASNTSKKAAFAYSFDNKTSVSLGNELSMKFNLKIFTGNKFGLFNYATLQTGGYVDIDWFRTDMP